MAEKKKNKKIIADKIYLTNKKINLTNNNTYIESCIQTAEEKLSSYKNAKEIEQALETINVYENISYLDEPKKVHILNNIKKEKLKKAKKCVLEGKFFAEHAAAGEATRLGLGTKYMINIQKDLSVERIAKLISEEKKHYVSEDNVIKEALCKTTDLLSISIGTRHMIQYSFDIYKLAIEEKQEPKEILAKQKMLIILNETSAEQIIHEFIQYRFFGFTEKNIFFMIQKSYHGIKIAENNGSLNFTYDKNSPKRLHNHGQMVMQETMDDEIFFIDKKGIKKYLKSAEFGKILEKMDDKLSYNIEDLGFLVGAIDYESLAMTLSMSDKGYRMVMEIVGNNPKAPQKGGMAAYDKKLKRNVMIEAFQLKGIKNSDIKYLNKNFNHYPKPYESWKLLKEKGLNMPFAVKNDFIYFQPIQGDINFLVKTQFVQRKTLKPIQSWKSPATTPLTMKYMKMQDEQKGFKEYAEKFLGKI